MAGRTVDAYIASAKYWQPELIKLRKILQALPLEETVKWGAPCYTHSGKNVVGLGAYKGYCGLWFYQGALLKDERGILVNAQEGKTKALRQWRFTAGKEIQPKLIKAYVSEALQLAAAGREIKPDRGKPLVIPDELKDALASDAAAAKGFHGLTPGRQREYAQYIGEAKQASTRSRRLAKVLPLISAGIGLNDKYR